jgi:polyisoprenoid-binding protein YceI
MATYKIDAMHSEITFKVKHLMITNVTGSFQQFDATLEAEPMILAMLKLALKLLLTAFLPTMNKEIHT